MSARVLTRLGLPFILLLAAACGGDDPEPVPPLGPPPVSPNFQVLTQGDLALDIPANGSQAIEPDDIMKAAGKQTPCVSLVFLFTYRVDGRKDEVEFTTARAGGSATVTKGAEGGASVTGCNTTTVKNLSDKPIKGTLRYVIAQGL